VSLCRPTRAAVFGSLMILASLTAGAQEPAPDAPTPWLGVFLVDEVDGGIRIVAVVPGGPAFRAGVRSGDLLIEAEDVQLADQQTLERLLEEHGSGQVLQFVVLRNGEPRTFRVQPADRARAITVPAPPTVPTPQLAPRPWMQLELSSGLKTVALTEELRAHYGAPEDRGVLVVRVIEDGPGGRAGIEVGDVLVGVGTEPVRSPAEVDLALARRDRSVALRVELVRDRESIVMQLAAASPVRVWPGKELRAEHLERSISMLEERIETLRKQLAELKNDPDPPTPEPEAPEPPANPDR